MIRFTAQLKKFGAKGDKTGWTYFEIPLDLAEELKPGFKKAFRVKGKLDNYKIAGITTVPMGGGTFIIAVNADMRKGIGKKHGAMIEVQLSEDVKGYELNKAFVECLADDPDAKRFFDSLPAGHRNYFSKWIDSAKTDTTRTTRIARAVSSLAKGWGYPEMVRFYKQQK